MTLSPIVLFAYNRPEHTRFILEALHKNDLALESCLYVFADGPKPYADLNTISDIEKTRSVVKSKKWCGQVYIQEEASNKGLASSIISGITEIIEKHGRVIVLEDDILTSPDFLKFMNLALDFYRNEEQVAGISGFSYPSTEVTDEVYFLPIGCSWGWATWRREWDQVCFDAEQLAERIQRRRLKKRFDFGGYPFFQMLLQQRDRKVDSWAIRFYASFFLRSSSFVYPPKSLVQNIGFDATATHTKEAQSIFKQVEACDFHGKFRAPIYDEMTLGVKRYFQKTYALPGNRMPMAAQLRSYLIYLKNRMLH